LGNVGDSADGAFDQGFDLVHRITSVARQTGAVQHIVVPESVLGPRDVVVVEGADALTYLQSQVSQDLREVAVGDQVWTFLLEPAGKVAAFARVTRAGDDRFELDTDAGSGESLLARIKRFMIRVRADASLRPADPSAPRRDEAERIEFGWPALGAELIPGETIPAATGLARIAISFTKGCYPGQELVERMDSRAASAPKTLRRLAVTPGTAPGDAVLDQGEDVGVITSVAGGVALAWVKRSSGLGTPVEL
jgi:folate-binding protein YgfZ